MELAHVDHMSSRGCDSNVGFVRAVSCVCMRHNTVTFDLIRAFVFTTIACEKLRLLQLVVPLEFELLWLLLDEPNRMA